MPGPPKVGPMRVVHERDEVVGEADASGEARTIATNVEVADSSLSHAKGLRFRDSLPDDYAYVMDVGGKNPLPFVDGPTRNVVDMIFMRVPLDIVWLRDDEVVKVKRMHPWRSFGIAKADTIIEFPAGGAEGIDVGDTVRVVAEGD
jgi:uncharacterized membrane protein (UPF0127 family)